MAVDLSANLPPGSKVVVLMRFGSHLYGTDTPTSDVDWKGVFIPPPTDILLGRIPKSISTSTGPKDAKNAPGDVDVEWYSLHYFLRLAMEGQTVAIDMLHAPDNWHHASSKEWRYLREHRREFHTKNLQAFVGYCRRQAAKYGVKGSRLAAVKDVIAVLECYSPVEALANALSAIDLGEHVKTYFDKDGRRYLQVCGKSLQDTMSIEQAMKPLKRFQERYGDRARQAESNDGIDWKAVSHAMRAAYELLDIYDKGDISFPLERADTLRDVKQGKLDYASDVANRLDTLMALVEVKAANSNLPESVHRGRWDDWLYGVTLEFVKCHT